LQWRRQWVQRPQTINGIGQRPQKRKQPQLHVSGHGQE
jgi:hypothetical protein